MTIPPETLAHLPALVVVALYVADKMWNRSFARVHKRIDQTNERVDFLAEKGGVVFPPSRKSRDD